MAFIIGITSDFNQKSEVFWREDFIELAKYFDQGVVYSLKAFAHADVFRGSSPPRRVHLFSTCKAFRIVCGNLLFDSNLNLRARMISIFALISFMILYFKTGRPLPDCVLCFWSHYPGVVLRFFSELSRILGVDIRVAGFAGAYDLTEYPYLTSSNLKSANYRFTHCDVNKKNIANEFGFEVARVYRGTDLANFVPMDTKTIREPSERRYAYIGRFDERKNIHKILPWFAKALGVFPDIKLRIIGDGPFQFSLRKQIVDMCIPEETISIEGWKTREQLIEVFTQIDVLIQPSDAEYERLPNIIKEALASGVVPISGPSEGINELISDEWGEVFDFSRSPSVEEIPKTFSESSEDLATKSALGRLHISEYFDRKKNIAELAKQIKIYGH